MATYKVIQDVEAEDKILGPLSLRQFVYGLISVFFLYICFIVLTKHAAYLLAVFLPPALFTGFFAFPFGRDQPTEVWALAKIRFLFKPRKRLWNQSGVRELVTITVPKKVEQFLTNGLSATEVQSRLKTLADTIDSRGWAVKNVNLNLYGQTGLISDRASDRLIDISTIPMNVPDYDVQPADDILDENNNPVAHQFESMINASTVSHRKQLMDELNGIRAAQANTPPNDYWFMNQSTAPQQLKDSQAMFTGTQIVRPGTDVATTDIKIDKADEAALDAQLKAQNANQQVSYNHLRTIQPLDREQGIGLRGQDEVTINHQEPVLNEPVMPSPTGHSPAIMYLADDSDKSVASLGKMADEANKPKGPADGEVVISLH